MAKKYLMLEIVSPDKTVFKGPVEYVSSTNKEGNFDILPDHIPFVSIINFFIITKTQDGKKLSYKINEAVLHCLDNNVVVFTDIEKISLQS